jgi:hypothetical protein
MELGSDHEVFSAAGWGIPMLYFHDWPDVTIHTSKDQPENLDVTKLGRVTYLGAGIAYTLAALPDAEAPKLMALTRAAAETDLAAARLKQAVGENARDGALMVREAVAQTETKLGTLTKRWPGTAVAAHDFAARLKAGSAASVTASGGDGRIPVRNPEVRGPLSVYYFDAFDSALKAQGTEESSLPKMPALTEGDPGMMEYEALNLADGRRSAAEIRDILTGRYEPVPLAFVTTYFDRLAAGGIIKWKAVVQPPPSFPLDR